MKKVLSLLLSLCMISTFAFSTNAIVVGKSVATQEESSLSVISKDMKTGEVTQSIYTCESKSSKYGVTLPSCVPSNLLSANSNITSKIDLKNIKSNNELLSGVIGTDDRVRVTNTEVFPYSAVCYIEMEFDQNPEFSGTATAFMIGDNIAVTAGHCVYKNGILADNVKVWPGKDGYGLWNNPFGTAEKIHIFAPAWDDAEDANSDWAVIILDDNIGNDTGWFGLSWLGHDTLLNTNLTISGYPGEFPYYQYTATDLIVGVEDYYIFHRIDMSNGQSGSPIYDSNGVVYGINTESYSSIKNRGLRLTLPIFNYLSECVNNY